MPPHRRHRETHPADRLFKRGLRLLAWLVIILFAGMVYQLYGAAQPALKAFGLGFYFTSDWDPVNESYGALSFIWGTLVTSFLALCLAVPISLGTALFLTEMAPRWLRRPLGFLVEMLAAIPSVVYGIWGVFVLAPFVRTYCQPVLQDTLGFLPFFQGPPFGIGVFSAGIILAIMIIPTITTIAREVFRAVPEILREGALALGATRWETIRIAVLRTGLSGIVGAIVLGLGRAVGETMAVAMVIGNRAEISLSLFKPGATLASVIANEYAEASSDLHLSSLTAVGLGLFFVSFVVNSVARSIVWRVESRRGGSSR